LEKSFNQTLELKNTWLLVENHFDHQEKFCSLVSYMVLNKEVPISLQFD